MTVLLVSDTEQNDLTLSIIARYRWIFVENYENNAYVGCCLSVCCVQAAKCRLVKILSPSASITFPVGSTELHTEIPQDHTQPGDFGYKNHEVILD